MCGLCGIIDYNERQVEERDLRPMMELLKHRGPDDEGTFTLENFGLGFLRLSILDLTAAGHQPMESSDGRYVLVFNGEIFNYLELREELEAKGHRFTSNSDTEVLLAAWQEWGEACQHRFNGMWAFAIFDKKKNILFASRDRYGIKPFYYSFDSNRFLFASEIPSLLRVKKSKPEPNETAVFDYLAYNRTDQNETTFFENIFKLQHGHQLNINLQDIDSLKICRWYNLRERVELVEPVSGPEEFYDLFESSVNLRLRSDVPVGVCLSGGLDSSSIVSTILKSTGRNDIHTFSAIYGDGVTGDESEFISEYESILKNMHYTTPTGIELYKELDDFIRTHAEPIPSTSPYAQFRVMKLASENVVVTLDGQGADELLAGYHYFFGFYFKELLKSVKLVTLAKEMSNYLKNHRSLYGLKTLLFFILPSGLRRLSRTIERGYIHPKLIERAHIFENDMIAGGLYGASTLYDALIHHFEYKLEHLLKWEDRNSMHFSIEARVPFLDFRMVEKTLALKGRNLIEKGITKNILRESMKGTLPQKIMNRQDKIGFGTPEDDWFRSTLFSDLIRKILQSEKYDVQNWINENASEKMLLKHLNEEKNFSKEIWKWLHLHSWYKEFIN